jgi:hypothetical protein
MEMGLRGAGWVFEEGDLALGICGMGWDGIVLFVLRRYEEMGEHERI